MTEKIKFTITVLKNLANSLKILRIFEDSGHEKNMEKEKEEYGKINYGLCRSHQKVFTESLIAGIGVDPKESQPAERADRSKF